MINSLRENTRLDNEMFATSKLIKGGDYLATGPALSMVLRIKK